MTPSVRRGLAVLAALTLFTAAGCSGDGEGSSGGAIYFTDATATAYALDAETGAPLWSRRVDTHASATGTGAPTLYDGVLYVPITGVSIPLEAHSSPVGL